MKMHRNYPDAEIPVTKRLKVLVITGHPRTPSLSAALADAYVTGARAAGMEVDTLNLAAMAFDPDVHPVSPTQQPLEPDLERARQRIAWADHLTFVYPAWWGVGPARLKGFLDRVLLPGFAFREREDGGLEGMLHGRTAHLVTTMDMPPWVYRWIYRAPGHNAMKRSTLGFCGIKTTRILALGAVRESSDEQRAGWLEQARALGFSLCRGPASRTTRVAAKALIWLKALRLQFYPMTWMAYTVGALGAQSITGNWSPVSYWLGYACLFFGEAATVFINEWFDYESDRRNHQFGPFNGGSRVLVNNELSFRETRIGVAVTLAVAAACAGLLLDRLDTGILPASLALLAMLILGPGYTAPPLKLAWRGLGELNVGLTHSLGVVVLGYLLQGGDWHHPFPWLVSLPLFLAVLPAIILSGIPDQEADRQAGKKTLVVRLGHGRATLLALILAVSAPIAVLLIKDLPALHGSYDGALPWMLPHAMLIAFLLTREWRQPVAGRKDRLMIASLTYIVWFALFPLLHLS